jgi:hypothetical protein
VDNDLREKELVVVIAVIVDEADAQEVILSQGKGLVVMITVIVDEADGMMRKR